VPEPQKEPPPTLVRAIGEYEQFDPLRKWWEEFLKYGRGNISGQGSGRTY
jgi:hypothetical protein